MVIHHLWFECNRCLAKSFDSEIKKEKGVCPVCKKCDWKGSTPMLNPLTMTKRK